MAGILLNRSRQVPAEETPAFGGIAERFRRAGDLDRAIALCRDGLKRFPEQLSARVTLGWALLDKGQYDEARGELEQVLRKAPDNLAAIRGLAELHDRSEGAMPSIEDRESWKQSEESAHAPAAAPLEATTAVRAETFVDPFAPIQVTLGSDAASAAPPELLHTAQHADLAAHEAAASAESAGITLESAHVELEDAATASMAAAEVPTPFFMVSPAEAAVDFGDESASSSIAFTVDEPDATEALLAFDAGTEQSFDVAAAPAAEWEEISLAPETSSETETAALTEMGEAFQAEAEFSESELADALKSLDVESPTAHVDLPAMPLTVEVAADDTAVVAFEEGTDAEVSLEATLAELQLSDVHSAPSSVTEAAAIFEPEALGDDVPEAAFEFATSELEVPEKISRTDFEEMSASFEVAAEELPDAVLVADLDEAREPVGLFELPAAEYLTADQDEVQELDAEPGAHFELVAPVALSALVEEPDAEVGEVAVAHDLSADSVMGDLFSLPDEPEPIAALVEIDAVSEPAAEVEFARAAEAVDFDLPLSEPEPAFDDPQTAVGESLPEPVSEVLPAARQDDDVPVAALAEVESAVADVLATITLPAETRPRTRSPLEALERFLRQVEARRLQLQTETVA